MWLNQSEYYKTLRSLESSLPSPLRGIKRLWKWQIIFLAYKLGSSHTGFGTQILGAGWSADNHSQYTWTQSLIVSCSLSGRLIPKQITCSTTQMIESAQHLSSPTLLPKTLIIETVKTVILHIKLEDFSDREKWNVLRWPAKLVQKWSPKFQIPSLFIAKWCIGQIITYITEAPPSRKINNL